MAMAVDTIDSIDDDDDGGVKFVQHHVHNFTSALH
jgi:hypothetical protein